MFCDKMPPSNCEHLDVVKSHLNVTRFRLKTETINTVVQLYPLWNNGCDNKSQAAPAPAFPFYFISLKAWPAKKQR